MAEDIVVWRVRAREDREEELFVPGGCEGFLLMDGGEALTLLPGPHRLGPGCRALALRCGAVCEGVAGAAARSGARGWFGFRCELISPRRFVRRQGEALLAGEDGDELLTKLARAALLETMEESGARGSRPMWADCRYRLDRKLLDCGWRLTGFRPERWIDRKEVPA